MRSITKFTPSNALKFVIFFGVISFFADMTYEGARGIMGPYLLLLGASATTVGLVAGFGELIGYALRLVFGYIADKTGRYWTITIAGYIINLLAVPALALTNQWPVAAGLLVCERMGKAIRNPARDAMLAHAGKIEGMGWAFGLNEALDQFGAMLGPLIVILVMYFNGSYQHSFAWLLIPAVCAISLVIMAKHFYPDPAQLEGESQYVIHGSGMNRTYWLYLLGASLVAAGFTDFALISYHFEKMHEFNKIWIPVIYALSMGINSISAPLLGYLYDKKGFIILIIVTIISCIFAPLVFYGNLVWVIIGMLLWSIGVGAHESLMKAIVAHMVPASKRSSAYGVFNTGYGVFWFLGSAAMGYLYDHSLIWLVVFSVAIQVLSLPILLIVRKSAK
ncbi:MAG: MFS transporter [Neisseriales bacterium]|nr:MAG: MFS transporter [Neisseriales bacterium]